MGRNVHFAPGEYYHLYNRGTDKRKIFSSRADYERFSTLLLVANGNIPIHLQRQGRTLTELKNLDLGEPSVNIGAYCLMPNHFHLLVRENKEKGISSFMQKLLTAYTMYFNQRYERTGALFQGKYRAIHASDDEYLRYLISYIHLNPVKLIDNKWKEEGLKNRLAAKKYLETYEYSSYIDYIGHIRPQNYLLDRKSFPNYFSESGDFDKEIDCWLNFNKAAVKVGP